MLYLIEVNKFWIHIYIIYLQPTMWWRFYSMGLKVYTFVDPVGHSKSR